MVDQAKRALQKARNAFSHMKANEQEDVAFGYTERQLFFYQGDVLTKLGQTIEADMVLEQALEKYSDHILDQTLIRLDMAQCRVIEGDIDEALEVANNAARLLKPEYRTDFILRPAIEFGKAVEDGGWKDHPGLKEFYELMGIGSKKA
ncbi:hypothetical protein [Nonomuraea dietziae]|uniref:hypothetical protein n=1 Tax=Nonomuraea dietziae TaxID=65515 RepID=UPI0031D53E8E